MIVLTFLTCVPVLKLILLTVEILSIDLSSSFRKVIIPGLSTSEQLLRQGQSFMTDENQILLRTIRLIMGLLAFKRHWIGEDHLLVYPDDDDHAYTTM